jgi:4-hydroxy-tetrahydrodipicolinate reductase
MQAAVYNAPVPIKVLHVGLGPIGAAVVRQVAARKGFVIVGAVDIDPAKTGREVGEVCGTSRRVAVKITADIAKTIKATKPDIAVLCTSSSLKKVVPEFEAVLKLKVPIVSTTEELAYPVKGNASAAKRIDALAKRARVAVLGTGVNPGVTMDALPIALTAVCEQVTAVEVDRVQDARIRRLPFQQKIGAGLTKDEFMERVRNGSVRHVGLAESISMIADAMGWKLDRITDEVHPKLAEAAVSSQFLTVPAGRVCGLIQDGTGYRKGQPLIRLHMEAYLGAPESYDAVRITGTPPIAMKIAGGVHGDIATASITVNSIPKVLAAAPGLRTMRDVALPSYASVK